MKTATATYQIHWYFGFKFFFFFFFLAGRFPFASRHTPIFDRYDLIRRESARFDACQSRIDASRLNPVKKKKKKKFWMRFDSQAAAPSRVAALGRVGRGCDGHFAASVHPRPLFPLLMIQCTNIGVKHHSVIIL